MQQLLSNSILIIGKDTIVAAISATLNFYFKNCQQQPQLPISFIHQYSFILSITSPSNVSSQIYHLRSKQWEGVFITIVSTSTEKKQLLDLSIFGEKDGKFAYSKIPGHKVAVIHTLFTDILSFRNDPGLSSGAWNDYLVKSSIHTLIQQLQQTSIDIQQVLTTIHNLNILWDNIISHEQARYIRELKQKYPLGTIPSPSEIPEIITNLQTRLAHI
jgi:hypothetical protein